MRKNILIFGHSYALPFVDILAQYSKLFDKNKYFVTVVYLTGEENEEVRQQTLAEKVIFLNVDKKNIRYLKIQAIKKLLTLTREMKFEMVICHRYKPTYIMLWVAKFCKIPVMICVMHAMETMTSLGRQLFIAAFARKNVWFAGVSNAVRDNLQKSLWGISKDKFFTLNNVIDIETIEPQLLSRDAARDYLLLTKETFLFGHLGRFVECKDQKNLIQAFALIKPFCPNAKLILMGSGRLEIELKNHVKTCGINFDDVIFTGFIANGFRYMKAFDCFVLSSIREAFGKVLLEAMIAKLPIITTLTHGIPEVIGDAGVLVQPKNSHELAAAMRNMYELSNSERENYCKKSYERVSQFIFPNFYKQFWSKYEKDN